MFETITWVRPDKSSSKIQVDLKEDRVGFEFTTGMNVTIEDLIRRNGVTYEVYEVLGCESPWTVRCKRRGA